MSARLNTNLIKRNNENYEKRRKKKYRQDIVDIIKTAFPAIAYGIVFTLQSIVDNSTVFSIALALFSTCVTISFEVNEWYIFNNSKHKKTKKYFNYYYPLLFALILLMILAFIYNGIATLFGIPEKIFNVAPNLISSFTLLGYFISYTIRQIFIRRQQYLDKKDNNINQ